MNWEKLKQNFGYWVHLVPSACRLDNHGLPLPQTDDDWLIDEIADDHIRASRTTGHFVRLGKDHIHHFTSNPQRTIGTIKFGFLTLHVQVFIQGNNVWVIPNNRPGEAVAPPIVEIVDKPVHFRFPTDSGIQQRLEAAGYRLIWANESTLPQRVDSEGWEVVIEPDANGRLFRFRAKDRYDDQVLLKKYVG